MTSLLTFPVRIYRHAIVDSMRIVKAGGFRELVRQRGWRFFAAVIAYYFVRDSLLYVVLPLCIARGWL
jgi:hypothetical protein